MPTKKLILPVVALLIASPMAIAISILPETGIGDDLHAMLHMKQIRDQQRQRDPIGALHDDMSVITTELRDDKTDRPVQKQQQQVVAQLDTLIEQLNTQCNGSGGGSNNPTKPMADSKIARGPGGSGPMHDPQIGTKQWGQLPPKEREKVLQSENDGFPAGYESILSSYYSRLAQEQVSSAATNTPATQPAGNQ